MEKDFVKLLVKNFNFNFDKFCVLVVIYSNVVSIVIKFDDYLNLIIFDMMVDS